MSTCREKSFELLDCVGLWRFVGFGIRRFEFGRGVPASGSQPAISSYKVYRYEGKTLLEQCHSVILYLLRCEGCTRYS